MKNWNLIRSKQTFNEFTTALRHNIERDGPVLVELRDGTKVVVQNGTPEELLENQIAFRTRDFRRIWNADGSSVTSENLDIIEF